MASYAGKFELSSHVKFQTKIAQHQVQLSLHYIHFEITKFNFYLGLFSLYKCFVDPAVSLFVESCKSCFFIFLQFDLFL